MKKINLSQRKEDILKNIRKLDISPSMYKNATEKYKHVGEYLLTHNIEAQIYPQGSFATGTVVRPYRNSQDASYDIDCICLLRYDKNKVSPEEVKNVVGDALKESQLYAVKLLPEDSRCWTLEYADINEIGFNLDVVPSVKVDNYTLNEIVLSGAPEELAELAISITDKKYDKYNWCNSNPRGYSQWFKEVNKPFQEHNREYRRQKLFEEYRDFYSSVEEIPVELERSSLQRVIQILKRHRDIYFSKIRKEQKKPISAIITTLVGKIGEANQNNLDILNYDVLELLKYVVNEIDVYSELLKRNQDDFNLLFESKSVVNKKDDRWTLLNPANPLDNLTDSWNKDNERAKLFFQWVRIIKSDFVESLEIDDDKFELLLENTLGSNLVKSSIDTKKYSVEPAATVIISTPKPYRR